MAELGKAYEAADMALPEATKPLACGLHSSPEVLPSSPSCLVLGAGAWRTARGKPWTGLLNPQGPRWLSALLQLSNLLLGWAFAREGSSRAGPTMAQASTPLMGSGHVAGPGNNQPPVAAASVTETQRTMVGRWWRWHRFQGRAFGCLLCRGMSSGGGGLH
jgi:hypothetical protein